MMESWNFYEIYYISIIVLYIWENLLVGNFEADRAQKYGKIKLPETIQKILFPFFYIKRFTYVAVIYQSFNFCIFVLMILIGIFVDKSVTVRIFELFFFYQIYCWYGLFGPMAVSFSITCNGLRLAAKGRRDKKNDIDTVLNIMKNMGAQSIQDHGNTVFYIEPVSTVKAYVFLIYIGRNYDIPEIDYIDTLNYLLHRGCLLVYISSNLFRDEKIYTLALKNTLQFFEEKYKTKKTPVLLSGRVILEVPVMTLLSNVWDEVAGMVWIGAQSKKTFKKIFEKMDLTDMAKSELTKMQKNICIVNIHDRNTIKHLDIWLSENYDL